MARLHNGHVLGAAAFITPSLSLFAGLGMTPLMIVTAFAAAFVGHRQGQALRLPRYPLVTIVGLALVWGLASALWGIRPPLAVVDGIARLAVLCVAGLVVLRAAAALRPDERDVFRRCAVAGLVLALVLLAFERSLDSPLRRLGPFAPGFSDVTVIESYDRGDTVLALMAFPVALALWGRRLAALALWGATAVLVALMPNGAASAAILLGGVSGALALRWPRAMLLTVGIAAVILTLVAPFAARTIPPPERLPVGAYSIPSSWHHRLMIWRFSAEKIVERPVLGWGYDSSRAIPGNLAKFGQNEPALPLHPHNGMLQWWLELGVVGALLGAAALSATTRAIRRLAGPVEQAAAVGQFVAWLVIFDASYGIWQGWWIATMFLSASFLLAATSVEKAPSPRSASD